MEKPVIDEQHCEVYKQIAALLATKVKALNEKSRMPFQFFKEGGNHTLAISARISKEIGLGLKTIIIRAENPWAVYSSLALLIINVGTQTL